MPLDLEAISGICGSVSIACWIVVFTPQILENFRRRSADGLSVFFIIVWLSGDVCNILGAVLQGVLPTMTILAVYYAFADTVLLSQCFYYRGFRFSDEPTKTVGTDEDQGEQGEEEDDDESPLLSRDPPSLRTTRPQTQRPPGPRRKSSSPTLSHHPNTHVDATHLSPTTPLLSSPAPLTRPSPLRSLLLNTLSLLTVILLGLLGWWLSHPHHPSNRTHHPSTRPLHENPPTFNPTGQIFGYLCAGLYLGSRVPQLLLNYRRKSTEGVSMLFFLFACVGNLTYVLSIFAHEPFCARVEGSGGFFFLDGGAAAGRGCEEGEWGRMYARWVLVNTSWVVGSAGTLLLDLLIFGQFWVYRDRMS